MEHLRERTDVQNIDMMNLAGFCRNCLSRWYREAAEAKGIGLADPDAREIVYGMPYKEWQAKYQKEASAGAEGRVRQGQSRSLTAPGRGRYPRPPCRIGGESMALRAVEKTETKTGGIAADRLRSLVDRIERLEEERKALGGDIRDIYAEAKSAGFDVKVLRQLIRMRKQEPADVEEQETLLDVYRRALGMYGVERSNASNRAPASSKGGPPGPVGRLPADEEVILIRHLPHRRRKAMHSIVCAPMAARLPHA